jgi:hypothetical protein
LAEKAVNGLGTKPLFRENRIPFFRPALKGLAAQSIA